MDFFQRQDDARRRSRLLVALFALSVLSIILLLYLLFGFLSGWKHGFLDVSLLAMTAGGAGFIISVGSGFKLMQLSAGGAVVARDLGGVPVDPDTRRPDERRLLNVVEEMALASGLPVPQVWVLEEEGINAFAAGHTPADAVIGVTRGCMRLLTRDELQGVIAHEFSHILNGDMRLNLRLIGVVHGLLVIAILGRILLEVASRGGHSRNNEGKDPRAILMLAGLGTLAAGYIGVFFGNLIKSAISRQREYLADAAAVQFTRNPDGIGGALLKIGAHSEGSRIHAARAEEASHMMFSDALHSKVVNLLATHPPLVKRIKAILPHWDGRWPEAREVPEIRLERNAWRREGKVSAFASGAPRREPPPLPVKTAPLAARANFGALAADAVRRVGQIDERDLDEARRMLGEMPDELQDLSRDPAGARAVVLAALLASGEGPREAERALLEQRVDAETFALIESAAERLRGWPSARVIALLDLSMPALRRLTLSEYEQFARLLTDVIRADNRTEVFEFMLQKMTLRHLDLYFRQTGAPPIRYRSFANLRRELEDVLGAFAGLGASRDPAAGAAALRAAEESLRERGVSVSLTPRPVSLEALDRALTQFDQATPLLKKQVLQACAAAVMADGKAEADEMELLRAVADTLGCPLPPFGAPERAV